MDDGRGHLQAARAAYARHAFDEAHAGFRAAATAPVELAAGDLAALADAAWWLGRVDESVATGGQAYRALLSEGRPREAAYAAIGVAVNHLLRGEDVPGEAWIGRAAELLADDPECAQSGFLRYLLEVEAALDAPDPDPVLAAAREVRELGQRLGVPDLVAMGSVGEGRVLVRHGRVADGLARLDEAMVVVLAGGMAPDWVGNTYCHMIAACVELTDLRRAAQWTAALERWLATLPAAVVFTGICRLHRCQVLQTAGEWERAEQAAAEVCAELGGIFRVTEAEGHYQLGELDRLRGRWSSAETAYRRAHRLGRDPQPGLALLRLARGRLDTAAAAIRTALVAETGDRLRRARLCAAQVEIALAGGDLAIARKAAAELAETAAAYRSPGLSAAAAQAAGAVLLAEGHAAEALATLRAACRRWLDLAAPYDCARTRLVLAAAYRELGDADSADQEAAIAEEVLDALGAAPGARAAESPAGLTEREVEVLACLAAGRTNREIAAALVISEKTVQRHLSNIFTKLGCASRTAAAAYAFTHGIAAPISS